MSEEQKQDQQEKQPEVEALNATLVKGLIEQAVDDKITQATTTNADLVTSLVEELVALKVKEAKDDTKKQANLQKALAKAKKEFKPLVPDRTAKYSGRLHHYSTLSAIKEATEEALENHGLVVSYDIINTFSKTGAAMTVKAILLHEGGGRLESSSFAQMINLSKVSQSGSDQTYLKRYAVCNLLGIESEPDNDPDYINGNATVVEGQKVTETGTAEETQALPQEQEHQDNGAVSSGTDFDIPLM